MGDLETRDPPLNARRPSPISSISGVLAACVLALALAAGQLARQQPPPASLPVLTRDGRRAMPISAAGTQEVIALDDLATAFQLNVRDDGGAITVGYKGRTIV